MEEVVGKFVGGVCWSRVFVVFYALCIIGMWGGGWEVKEMI